MNNLYTRLYVCLMLAVLSFEVVAECNNALAVDTPSQRFALLEGVTVDRASGLMWSRCTLGLQWQQGTCVAVGDTQWSWGDALLHVASIEYAGYSDWRLPNRKELESIVERACTSPALNEEVFPAAEIGLYWTSTPNVGRPDASWVVDFTNGSHRNLQKTELGYVRLVRSY